VKINGAPNLITPVTAPGYRGNLLSPNKHAYSHGKWGETMPQPIIICFECRKRTTVEEIKAGLHNHGLLDQVEAGALRSGGELGKLAGSPHPRPLE
jgi:hypothetical protein